MRNAQPARRQPASAGSPPTPTASPKLTPAQLPSPQDIALDVAGRGRGWDEESLKKGAREAYAAIREALIAEADRIEEEWQRTGKGQRDHQVPLRAFAALVPAAGRAAIARKL